jgi:hypothetical protein
MGCLSEPHSIARTIMSMTSSVMLVRSFIFVVLSVKRLLRSRHGFAITPGAISSRRASLAGAMPRMTNAPCLQEVSNQRLLFPVMNALLDVSGCVSKA